MPNEFSHNICKKTMPNLLLAYVLCPRIYETQKSPLSHTNVPRTINIFASLMSESSFHEKSGMAIVPPTTILAAEKVHSSLAGLTDSKWFSPYLGPRKFWHGQYVIRILTKQTIFISAEIG